MTPTRREALLMTGYAVTASLAGCRVPLRSETHRIDLELRNYTAEPQQVKIELLRTDAEDHAEALVFSRGFDVPAQSGDESAGFRRQPDIVERRPYIIRAQPRFGNGRWYHHHYYPGESTADAENAHFDVRLYRRENSDDVYPRFFM